MQEITQARIKTIATAIASIYCNVQAILSAMYGIALPGTSSQVTTIVSGLIGAAFTIYGILKNHDYTWAGLVGTKLTRAIKRDWATHDLTLLRQTAGSAFLAEGSSDHQQAAPGTGASKNPTPYSPNISAKTSGTDSICDDRINAVNAVPTPTAP